MKSYFIILLLFFIPNLALGDIYLNDSPFDYWRVPKQRLIMRNVFNPWNVYPNTPAYYGTNNLQNTYYRFNRAAKLTPREKIRNHIRYNTRRNLRNISWFSDKNKKGTMTGYSTPISEDIYKQFGLTNDPKQTTKSSPHMMDLFSAPNTDNTYESRDKIRTKTGGNGGVASKTGVTIIYD